MAELRAGDVVDQRYRIVGLIGAGGMASVFEVHEVNTGQRLAMKVLHRQLLLHPVIPQRFLREAQAASALDTPFAVKVEGTGNMAD
ncbi:MAG: serine/threonine protein kinase, partial [Myxococcota bacterium]